MNIETAIIQRYSVREYRSEQPSKELILKVLESGRLAPSAVNYQPWHFLVVTESYFLEKVKESYHREWFKKVPMAIIILSDHTQSWKRASDQKDHSDIDAAIAIDHMTLTATSLGLGTCWICNFDPELLKNICNTPSHLTPVAILAMGFPLNKTIPEKKRKLLTEIVSWNAL